MWGGLSEVDEVDATRSHFYRQQSEFSSVPSDCSSDLKVQNLIADQVEKGKVIVCICHQRELIVQCNANMGEFQDYLTLVGECLDTGKLWEVKKFEPILALVRSTFFRIRLFLQTPAFLGTRKLSPATLAELQPGMRLSG